MSEFFSDIIGSLTWKNAIIGVLIFVGSFLFNLAIVSFIVVKLPADFFSKKHETKFWAGPNPTLRVAGIIGKNILGVLLVALGVVLSLPGVLGQGLLTILLGIVLIDFPGKRGLEQKLLRKPGIRKSINNLRARFDKPPFELD
jgi:hypothetical protein